MFLLIRLWKANLAGAFYTPFRQNAKTMDRIYKKMPFCSSRIQAPFELLASLAMEKSERFSSNGGGHAFNRGWAAQCQAVIHARHNIGTGRAIEYIGSMRASYHASGRLL